jgi:8-oxo-dGTP pyrophosphatase MutT (NUDIX family)
MDLFHTLITHVNHQLPGEEAHLNMSPLGRKKSSEAKKEASKMIPSGVALILHFNSDNQLNLTFIQRQVYDGKHSGQIGFPGGKFESTDLDLKNTAIRETQEEIGLNLEEVHYIGKLTDVFIPVTTFHIEPHLFLYTETPEFIKDEREVAEIFNVPLSHLLEESNIRISDQILQNGIKVKNIPYFAFQDKQIWGATALMINELRHIFLRDDFKNAF